MILAWLGAWLVAAASLSTLHWHSPSEPPDWPLQAPFLLSLLAIWGVAPGWAAALGARQFAVSAGRRFLLGAGMGAAVALANTALAPLLRGRGDPDPDVLIVGIITALGVGATGSLVGVVAGPRTA